MFVHNFQDSIFDIDLDCCSKKCLYQWTPASLQQIQELHRRKNKQEVNESLTSLFKHAKKISNTWIFTLKGKELCNKAIREIFEITDYSFNKYRKLGENNTIQVYGNIGRMHQSSKTSNAISWLRNFVEGIGEQQPNSSYIHLPSYLNKSDLYEDYVNDMKMNNEPYIHLSHFAKIWKEHFPLITIPAQTKLGRCTTCTSFENRKQQIQTQEELLIFKKERRQHFQLVSSEREALSRRKIVAKVNFYMFLFFL